MKAGRNGARMSVRSLARTKPILVTGGAGFIGCNLVDRLATSGEHVLVLDRLSRPGVERNMEWLLRRHPGRVTPIVADIRGLVAADAVGDAAAVFHLAAQVAVTTSLEDPLEDLDVNVRATLALLDAAARRRNPPPFIFASTNKVYGSLDDIDLETTSDAVQPVDPEVCRFGINEDRPLDFHTPYGCSKGAADQYVLDYARTRGVPSVVLRMSCIYGPHQHGNEDQGWVAHFLIRALRGEPISIYGDGHQVRDILYVDDAVEAYVRAWQHSDALRGRAFNLGGGPQNAVSLLQLLNCIGELHARRPEIIFDRPRPSDQRYFVSDPRRIRAELSLPTPVPWRTGVSRLSAWLADSTIINNGPDQARAVESAS